MLCLKPVRKPTDNDINQQKAGKENIQIKSENISHLCLSYVCAIQSSGYCELEWKSYLPGPLVRLNKLRLWQKETKEKSSMI